MICKLLAYGLSESVCKRIASNLYKRNQVVKIGMNIENG